MTKQKNIVVVLALLGRGTDFGIIITRKTGIVYENQCGGLSCSHLRHEGAFVPIDSGSVDIDFMGEADYVSPEDADKIDVAFLENTNGLVVTVDRERIKESREAFVYVNVSTKDGEKYPLIENVENEKGVLVWLNSD